MKIKAGDGKNHNLSITHECYIVLATSSIASFYKKGVCWVLFIINIQLEAKTKNWPIGRLDGDEISQKEWAWNHIQWS